MEEQTLQWPKRKRANITMAKEKKDIYYNGQREKGQTLQWLKRKRTNITTRTLTKHLKVRVSWTILCMITCYDFFS
jgi:hypothetical protein